MTVMQLWVSCINLDTETEWYVFESPDTDYCDAYKNYEDVLIIWGNCQVYTFWINEENKVCITLA